MKKFEALTLEKAYEAACSDFECSISMLKFEVLQHPSKGILGLLKKKAIIMAALKNERRTEPREEEETSEPSLELEANMNEYLRVPSSDERTDRSSAEDSIGAKRQSLSPELAKDPIVEGFFNVVSDDESLAEESVSYDELALMIEAQLKELIDASCFDIDVVEVDVLGSTALIFLDGEDAALLIGKEGYRYNALSYMILNGYIQSMSYLLNLR